MIDRLNHKNYNHVHVTGIMVNYHSSLKGKHTNLILILEFKLEQLLLPITCTTHKKGSTVIYYDITTQLLINHSHHTTHSPSNSESLPLSV